MSEYDQLMKGLRSLSCLKELSNGEFDIKNVKSDKPTDVYSVVVFKEPFRITFIHGWFKAPYHQIAEIMPDELCKFLLFYFGDIKPF
tara:strand:+ start:229 stop:489 length:261 start_codon:yes stop_codon:yes gene_type:complete